MNHKSATTQGVLPDLRPKPYTVHVQETQESWGVVQVYAASPEEAERFAEDAFDPAEDCQHTTSCVEAMVLSADNKPLAAGGRPDPNEAGRSAEVPLAVTAAVRAVFWRYFEGEARDLLAQNPTGRAAHVFPHLVALARYAAPDCLRLLADTPEVLRALCDTK